MQSGKRINNMTTPLNLKGQTISGHHVRVQINAETKQRTALIDGRMRIPLELLPLGAGKDAWMRKIVCKCEYCGTRHEAGTMEQSGNGLQCGACFDQAGEENAAMDAGE